MAVGFLSGRRLHISAAGGYKDSWPFASRAPGQVDSPYSLEGLELAGTLTQANVADPFVVDLDPYMTIDGAAIDFDIPRGDSATWPLGDYDLVLRVLDPNADADLFTIYSRPADTRIRVLP
jgi:hypothetical protein